MSQSLERRAISVIPSGSNRPVSTPSVQCPFCRIPPPCVSESDFARVASLIRRIGSGSFCDVFEANADGAIVAVKVPHSRNREYNTLSGTDPLEVRLLLKEYEILKGMRHPNIITVYGCSLDPPRMAMEMHSGGTLWNAIHGNPEFMKNWPKKLAFAKDIAAGMKYWYARGCLLCHGDLTTSNILISSDGRAIITDATLAKAKCVAASCKHSSEASHNSTCHSPEVNMFTHCGEKSDVYSFGMILYELLTGTTPFGDKPSHPHDKVAHEYHLHRRIARDKERPQMPTDLTEVPGYHPVLKEYVDLVESCWNQFLNDRPTFAEVYDHLLNIEQKLLEDKHSAEANEQNSRNVLSSLYSPATSLFFCAIICFSLLRILRPGLWQGTASYNPMLNLTRFFGEDGTSALQPLAIVVLCILLICLVHRRNMWPDRTMEKRMHYKNTRLLKPLQFSIRSERCIDMPQSPFALFQPPGLNTFIETPEGLHNAESLSLSRSESDDDEGIDVSSIHLDDHLETPTSILAAATRNERLRQWELHSSEIQPVYESGEQDFTASSNWMSNEHEENVTPEPIQTNAHPAVVTTSTDVFDISNICFDEWNSGCSGISMNLYNQEDDTNSDYSDCPTLFDWNDESTSSSS